MPTERATSPRWPTRRGQHPPSRRAPRSPHSRLVPEEAFALVVANEPLVAIDLLVQDAARRVLLGWRGDSQGQGHWLVPGGRLRKEESLAAAFARISEEELGRSFHVEQSVFVGLYQHFYPDGHPGHAQRATHYVALAHRLWSGDARRPLPLPIRRAGDSLRAGWRWEGRRAAAADPAVHPFSRAYFGG